MRIFKTKWYIERLRTVNHDLNGKNWSFDLFPNVHIDYMEGYATGIIIGWLLWHVFINNIPHENEDIKIPWE